MSVSIYQYISALKLEQGVSQTLRNSGAYELNFDGKGVGRVEKRGFG